MTSSMEKEMSLGRARGARRSLAQGAGIALLTALLAACGGGGGGGGGTGGGGAGGGGGGGGAGGGDGALGSGNGAGTCAATQNTTANGFVLGVCENQAASGGITFDVAHREVSNSEAAVSVVNFATKSYTLTLPDFSSTPVTLTAADETSCANVLGQSSGALLEQENSPAAGLRSTLLSFSQPARAFTAGAGCNRNASAQPAALTLQTFDFGAWERAVSSREFYYGGWYARRPAVPAQVPSSAVASGNRIGVAVGYLFNAVETLGTSGQVRNVAFDAASRTISGTIDSFALSSAGPIREATARLVSLSFAGVPVDTAGNFDGALSGNANLILDGVLTTGAVTGRIKGSMLTAGASGVEVAGRFQAAVSTQTGAQIVVRARAAGSFAIAAQ